MPKLGAMGGRKNVALLTHDLPPKIQIFVKFLVLLPIYFHSRAHSIIQISFSIFDITNFCLRLFWLLHSLVLYLFHQSISMAIYPKTHPIYLFFTSIRIIRCARGKKKGMEEKRTKNIDRKMWYCNILVTLYLNMRLILYSKRTCYE